MGYLRFWRRKKILPGVTLNFGKRGISASVGVRGAHVTVGRRGARATVGIPGTGLFYTEQAASRRQPGASAPQDRTRSTSAPESVAPIPGLRLQALMQPAGAASSELARALTMSRRPRSYWAWGFLGGIAVFVAVGLYVAILGLLVGSVVSVLWLWPAHWLRQRDIARKAVVVTYDVEHEYAARYGALLTGFASIERSQRNYRVLDASTVVGDYQSKVNLGVGTVVRRVAMHMHTKGPKQLTTNIAVPTLEDTSRATYFLPDRILVRDGTVFSDAPYKDISVEASSTRCIEDPPAPSDAEVVDTTWRYLNKEGGPDLRFNNNVQMPIINASELILTSFVGLNEMFQFSRPGSAEEFAACLRTMVAVGSQDVGAAIVRIVPPDGPKQTVADEEYSGSVPPRRRAVFRDPGAVRITTALNAWLQAWTVFEGDPANTNALHEATYPVLAAFRDTRADIASEGLSQEAQAAGGLVNAAMAKFESMVRLAAGASAAGAAADGLSQRLELQNECNATGLSLLTDLTDAGSVIAKLHDHTGSARTVTAPDQAAHGASHDPPAVQASAVTTTFNMWLEALAAYASDPDQTDTNAFQQATRSVLAAVEDTRAGLATAVASEDMEGAMVLANAGAAKFEAMSRLVTRAVAAGAAGDHPERGRLLNECLQMALAAVPDFNNAAELLGRLPGRDTAARNGDSFNDFLNRHYPPGS